VESHASGQLTFESSAMSSAATPSVSFLRDPVRRSVALLATCQALFQSVQSMAITATPLAGYMLLGEDKSWATLPIFLVHFGLLITTIPASFLMNRFGRRFGFTVGGIAGIICGGFAAYAMYIRSFELLCVAAVFQGIAASFAWYFRFAAADAADASYKAKAISLVMAGGVVAGFVGPQTAKWAVDMFAPVTFAGIYVMVMVFSTLILFVVQALRIPPLTATEKAEGGRPMSEIIRQPAYMVALASSMFGFATMTLVMSATPLAMLACGFQFTDSATVIQGHVIAMFLPSFFTGHLITKFGVLRIIAIGAVLQAACALVNLSGIQFAHFFIANILVGLGWNFTFVGGTTLLTTTYRPVERAKVQASHDFVVYATTATAAGVSGLLAAGPGWAAVNLTALPMMGVVLIAASGLMAYQRRQVPIPA
jgi:MFS family permease